MANADPYELYSDVFDDEDQAVIRQKMSAELARGRHADYDDLVNTEFLKGIADDQDTVGKILGSPDPAQAVYEMAKANRIDGLSLEEVFGGERPASYGMKEVEPEREPLESILSGEGEADAS